MSSTCIIILCVVMHTKLVIAVHIFTQKSLSSYYKVKVGNAKILTSLLMSGFWHHFIEYILLAKSLTSCPSTIFHVHNIQFPIFTHFNKFTAQLLVLFLLVFICFVVFIGVLAFPWTQYIKRTELGQKPEELQAPDSGPLGLDNLTFSKESKLKI